MGVLSDRMFKRLEDPDWRHAAAEVTRIEGLSDAVFGFAITLLVVSLEVPKTVDELLEAMRGFIAFGLAFALLIYIWHRQYQFFRRYRIADSWTLTLNAILLFVVLFFVYPLKFLSALMIDEIMGYPLTVRLPGGGLAPRIAPGQQRTILVIYGLGYAAVFLVFALLYVHAYRRRAALGLDAMEALTTRETIRESSIQTAIALASVSVALTAGARWAGAAGLVYLAAPLALTANGVLAERERRRPEAALARTPPDPGGGNAAE